MKAYHDHSVYSRGSLVPYRVVVESLAFKLGSLAPVLTSCVNWDKSFREDEMEMIIEAH